MTIAFAADAAATPISALKQEAKALSKSEGIKLHEALNRIAQKTCGCNWDTLMENAWILEPAGSTPTAHQEFHVIKGYGNLGPMTIGFMAQGDVKEGPFAQYPRLDLISSSGADRYQLAFYDSNTIGRNLQISPELLEGFSPENPLQKRARAYILCADDMVRRAPLILTSIEKDDISPDHLPEPKGHLKIAVDIPGEKARVEVEVPLSTTAEEFRDRFRKDETPFLYGFRMQKDGTLLLRRSKMASDMDAEEAASSAAMIVSFLSWSGLEFAWGEANTKALSDQHMMTIARDYRQNKPEFSGHQTPHPFDHVHVMRHRETGQTVVLNQPYSGNSNIVRYGIVNLLSSRTAMISIPRHIGLHAGSLKHLYTFRDNGVDLREVGRGALIGDIIHRGLICNKVLPGKGGATTQDSRTGKSRKYSKKMNAKDRARATSEYIAGLNINTSSVPIMEKSLINKRVPDSDTIRKPYWKGKMKAFEDREFLSWDLQDKYNDTGINLTDVVDAVNKCPLDADIWGFFGIFDLQKETKMELYRRGTVAGELFLGKTLFEDDLDCWGNMYARPYIRCLNLLFRELLMAKRPGDALPLGLRIMELCPRDNLGLRFFIEEVRKAVGDPEIAEQLSEMIQEQDEDARS